MAIEVEAAGQVDEFIRVLKQRIWWILVPLAVIGSLGVFFAVIVPKKYVSRSQIMVRNLNDQSGEFGQNAAAVEGQVAAWSIRADKRIDSVLNALKWPDYAALNGSAKAEYREDKVLKFLSVELPGMPRNSGRQAVKLSFKNSYPERAVGFLLALQKSWTVEVLQRHLGAQVLEVEEHDAAIAGLESKLVELRGAIANIRAENSIPWSTRADGESERRPVAYDDRDRAYARLQALEIEIREAADQLEIKQVEYASLPADDFIEFDENDPLTIELNALDEAIGRAETDIETKGWAPGHSERRNAERTIRGLKVKRDRVRLERDDMRSSQQSVRPNSKKASLAQVVNALEAQVDQKTLRYDELEIRHKELILETERLNEAFSRLDQLNDSLLEAQVTKQGLAERVAGLRLEVATMQSEQGNPFEVLSKPNLPTRPTSPNPWAIGLGSIVFGLGLGFALAILLEYSKNCFRSPRELSRVMPHPVLGTINAIQTRRERARAFVTRAALGGGSVAFVGAMTFVTWAWSANQEALNTEVVKAINAFRDLLM